VIDERDEMIERIASVLRPLPQVDDSAKARVLVAIAAERERGREALRRSEPRRTGRTRWIVGIAGGAAAAMVAAFVLHQPQRAANVATARVASAALPEPTRLAGRDAAAEADAVREAVQLVFRAPNASSVRVVGDFNAWDKERAPMTRDAASGLWSVTLALRPGRHVYAFIVDDTLWMRDPRATAAPDADFGRPGSVLLVGRP
jgi:hypothetical protein